MYFCAGLNFVHHVRVHDIHCGLKSYKLKLLGKSVVQHGIRALFGGVKCSNFTTSCLFAQFIKSTCQPKKWRLHMREGVRVHNIHCEPKSNKIKLLGKLVVQHIITLAVFLCWIEIL